MFIVYVIISAEGYKYIGQTSNLERRLLQHNLGISKWTKRGSNWKLIYKEEYLERSDARKRENYFKTGAGREYLNKLIV